MKKAFIAIVLTGLLAAVAAGAVRHAFLPIYGITGKVNSIPEASADDRNVYFYKTLDEYNSGIYANDVVGATGASAQTGRFVINAFQRADSWRPTVGDTFYVGTDRDERGYGAGPKEVKFTGKQGYEIAPEMTMVMGGGLEPAPSPNQPLPPRIGEIWFGKRLYQRALVAKGEKFIVSSTPLIKAGLEGQGDSGIKQESVAIVIDEGRTGSKTFGMAEFSTGMSVRKVAALVSSLNVEYQLKREDKLEIGDHTVTLRAADATGSYSTAEVCNVTIMGGPASVIGPIVVYPSPFSPKKDGNCTIQYTLSTDTDIEIYIYAISMEIQKKIYCRAGAEGGSAGVNKVVYNGQTTFEKPLANGIYSCTLYDASQGKTLAAFKMTVFN